MLKIRLAKEKDLDRLAQIYEEVYQVFDVGEEWTKEAALKLLNYWYGHQQDLFFVAEVDGEVVGGFVAGVQPWWDGNHLVEGELFVRPDYQKKGIGSKLLKVLFEKAIEKYDIVAWDAVTFKGEYPWEWYKKLGFKKNEKWILFSGDPKEALKRIK